VELAQEKTGGVSLRGAVSTIIFAESSLQRKLQFSATGRTVMTARLRAYSVMNDNFTDLHQRQTTAMQQPMLLGWRSKCYLCALPSMYNKRSAKQQIMTAVFTAIATSTCANAKPPACSLLTAHAALDARCQMPDARRCQMEPVLAARTHSGPSCDLTP
jgi:hypothetical protein